MAYVQMILTPKDVIRFWSAVDFRKGDECWPWKRQYFKDGYGQFKTGTSALYRAHRIAWMLANAEQPNGFVCHRCDNPSCVNPDHLWLGDAKKNGYSDFGVEAEP